MFTGYYVSYELSLAEFIKNILFRSAEVDGVSFASKSKSFWLLILLCGSATRTCSHFDIGSRFVPELPVKLGLLKYNSVVKHILYFRT